MNSYTQTIQEEKEEPEGLGNDDDLSWGNYPIDEFLIRTESRTVHDVLRRIGRGQFVMDPDFQRDFIWKEDKQSKLIESVLMRIPLPVFYLAEDEDGRMAVVDGLQRLSTFQNFVEGGLRLRLKDSLDLDRKSFEDLSPRLQNRVEDCNLVVYVIDAKVPERARLDIFERVNSGEPLTRQQMRNSLYLGSGTQFLKDQANSQIFLKATGNSLRRSTMRDREFVNRFCGFQVLSYHVYRGDMDDFLAQTLKRMNKMDSGELDVLSKEFQNGLRNNLAVFKAHAFRKYREYQKRRSVINASLWDVMATGLSRLSVQTVETRASCLRSAFHRLMDNEEFMTAITSGTNDTRRVVTRFEATRRMFQEVFDDYPT